jgi:hypothetical protein
MRTSRFTDMGDEIDAWLEQTEIADMNSESGHAL